MTIVSDWWLLSNDAFETVETRLRILGLDGHVCSACGLADICVQNPECGNDGGTARCSFCAGCGNCDTQRRLLTHYLAAGLGVNWLRLDWEEMNFTAKPVVDLYLGELRANLKAGLGLTFLGPVGTGKTTAAMHVAKQAVQSLRSGEKVQVVRFDRLIASYNDDGAMQRMRDVRLLLVDEMFAPHSEAQANLYDSMATDILGSRYDNNAATLITANLTPTELEHHYPRLASRQGQTNEVLAMEGDDRRRDASPFRTSGPLT
jgi:DNA replication protein DnaC